jgi:DNA repair exonuclease SbcCD ATPase subunit
METERNRIINSPAVKTYQAANSLKNLKEILGLVEAALVMSLEGTSRATVTEVLRKATDEYGVTSTTSVSGQIFSQLKVKTTMTHGKLRLVLDTAQLKSLKDWISGQINEISKELADILAEYKDIGNRINQLEEKLKETIRLNKRERELTQQLQQVNSQPSRVPYLEQELAKKKKEAEQVIQLEQRCKETSEKIKALPSLQEREKKLAADIVNYQTKEKDIVDREARLGTALEQLKMRSAWVTYLDLNYNIQNLKTELKEITDQINERRSLLQKILGTNKVR